MKINFVSVFSLENTLKQGKEFRKFYLDSGIDSAYVIIPLGKNMIPAEEKEYEDRGSLFIVYLVKNRMQPIQIIRNPTGEDSFAVYFVKPLWETLDRVFISE